ncbi:hypothetical protein Hanom_Chr15g01357811 [Helianthus anomalus]
MAFYSKIKYHKDRGEGFKGRGGAPAPPNFSVNSVIYTFRIGFCRYIRFRPPGFIKKLGIYVFDPPVLIFLFI